MSTINTRDKLSGENEKEKLQKNGKKNIRKGEREREKRSLAIFRAKAPKARD